MNKRKEAVVGKRQVVSGKMHPIIHIWIYTERQLEIRAVIFQGRQVKSGKINLFPDTHT